MSSLRNPLADTILTLYVTNPPLLTPEACLALHANTFISCQQYKKLYRTVNDASGNKLFTPLNELAHVDEKYLPGSENIQYSFDQNVPIFANRNQHGTTDALNRNLQIDEMDPPNVTGHCYYYDKAVASALKDIEGAKQWGVKSLPQLVRNSIDHFNVYIRWWGRSW